MNPRTSRRLLARVGGFISAVTILFFNGWGITSATGQTLIAGWNQLSPANNPSPRYIQSMAYDASDGQIVLFGGFGFSGDLNDTWLWNGTTWTQANPTHNPSPRSAEAMAYDSAHNQVVLFGGLFGASTRYGDTWVWNGTDWTQLSPVSSPPARASSGMVYDAAHGNIVMFGGIDAGGSRLGDTWLWNGTNWAQANPASSPSPRADFSMAYDAARGQVIFFGGSDNFGQDRNDTWAWNGTNWTQLSLANSPPARDAQAMAFSPLLGVTVMFGGKNTSALNDTWLWDGTNWTQQATATAPSPRYVPREMVYDAQQGQIVLFGGRDPVSDFTDTWTFGQPQNFGNINVCPGATDSPAPCSVTFALTYKFPTTTTLGTPQVVTQGTANLDFVQANGGNCTGVISAGNSCTLNVKFAPIAIGLRLGAVNLFDSTGNLLTTTPIYGNGQGPEVAFGPATQTPVQATALNGPDGLAMDASGNLFIANSVGGTVVKIAPGGAQTTVPITGLNAPASLAVNGAGDLFIADSGNNRVVKLPAGSEQTTVGTGLSGPTGVAVDGAGNVFIADSGNNRIVEITPGGVQTALPVSGLNNPTRVAVDGAGGLFISDHNNNRVVEIPDGCASSSCQTVVGTGLSGPDGVAIDAAGNVVIVDSGNNQVVEVPAGGATQIVVATGLNNPSDAVLGPNGDLFISDTDNNQAVRLNRSAGALNFGEISNNIQTSDSPLSIQNIGNQTLTGSVGPVSGAYFFEDGATSTCTTFALAPGAACIENFYAHPQAIGQISASATVSDNSLNGNPASQSVNLSAFSIGPAVTVSVTGPGTGSGFVVSNPTAINCSLVAGVASGTCSAQYSTGLQLSFEEAPTAGSTFAGWGGACASAGMNQFCTVSISGATTIAANFTATGPPPADTVAVTLIGSGRGTVTDNSTGINCTLASGHFTGTCSFNYPAGSQLTLTATPALGSTFAGWGTPCSGTGPCTFTVDNPYDVSAAFQLQSFGNVNVCPSGQNSPLPCSQSLPITFNIPATTTLGAIQVVTQGVTGLDFALGNGGTCSGTINAGNNCTVNVAFTPLAPGLRMGAVTLYDGGGAVVATQQIYGVGQAPLAAFSPAAPVVVDTTASYTLDAPNGAAVDAAGNLFISDSGNHRIVKVAANGSVSALGVGLLDYPQGLAVDGAGNLYIADNNLNQVVKITPAGVQTQMNFGLTSQLGVAVDGSGNVFVSSFNAGQVVMAPAGCTSGACTTVIYSAPSGLHPVGLASDAAGNIFVTALSLPLGAIPGQVVKIPPGCTTSTCQISVGSGWFAPEALAVDAAGNVFVADEASKIVEVPVGCAESACQITLSTAFAFGIAVDSKGDVIIPDRGPSDIHNNQVIVLTGSQPPSLSFALANVGSTSSDSPRAVSVQNVGNQPLTGSMASSFAPHFNASGTCTTFSLAPGAFCSESFSFKPQSTGYFTGTAIFSDSTLNLSPAVVHQQVNMTGTGGLNGQATTTAVPNVVGFTEQAANSTLTNAGLVAGSVSTASSSVVPSGSVIASNPAAGTQVDLSSAVKLLISSGPGQPPAPNPLSLLNNYFVTGDYASAGVNLHGVAAVNGKVSGTINIPASSGPGNAGVPTGADLIDGLLYWTTLENSASPSGSNATFLGYAITGQQIGSDLPYTEGAQSGKLRVYRANVNAYFQNGASGIRAGSGIFTISLPGTGTNGILLTEGASLVVIYRVLSPAFPLKAVVIYDGSAIPASSTTQTVKGFYDAAGGGNGSGEVTTLFVNSSGWNNSSTASALGQPDQYNAPLNSGAAYAAVILSTRVNNPDNDGILGEWKSGPSGSDFHSGEPGYYDVKTGLWVALPGARAGRKDLFVQLDWMCGAVRADGSCDPSQENLFPSPDPQGNDPLAIVQKAFAQAGITLHLQIGNAVPEDTCTDSPGQPCQFPGQPGVVGWKNSLEFSKVWPRNFTSCIAGGDCSPRFAYGQKDSYHYVLFGHSLAIPAWNTRYQTLTSIVVAGGVTTLTTTDRGTGKNACPSRITISGVLGNPTLNGVYNTTTCNNSTTQIVLNSPGVPNWNYPNNTLPEPLIGITSGTVTSISGYSDLGGADSAVTLGLWATAPNQDMSKRANVIAGTLFHELGHTIGLGHGGIYYDQGNYVPTFEANCKPNYQSIMNYLFQLDGVGPSGAVAFSNQTLTTLTRSSLGSVNQLVDTGVPGASATFGTSTWYVPAPPSPTASSATLHCDGAPLGGDIGYRVTGSVAPITPAWANGQNITFDGQPYSSLRGFSDLTNIDLRQTGATGGQFASLSSVLSFGSSATPLNIAPGGSVSVGPGGTVTLGAGGSISVSGGNITVPGGGVVNTSSTITLGTGGNVTLGAGGTITPGTNGVIGLPSGGNITLGGGGTITLGAGGTVTLGGGGTVTLGGGGTITLGAGGSAITVPSTGGSYTVPAGGTITLGGGGTVTLGAGGNVTLGAGGTVTLGGGGNITLGGGGVVTLGAGGTVTLGGGGNVTLGGGGNITLGGGGTITLGAGGNVTLGGGGNVTLGGGGTVTLGAGGDVSVGSGGNVTLGAGGTVTLGAGGNITLGAGGNITLSSSGTVTLGGGGTVTLNTGGNVTLGAGGGLIDGVQKPAGGPYPVASGGVVTLGAGGVVTLGGGGNITLGAGGNITLGGGGTITLGGGGNITLGAGGVVTLGGGGNVTLGAGGNITLGGGGNVTLGGGGVTSTELDYESANSVVRPPPSATYTVQPAAVRVDWTAPAFGVVQTYTISRSVNGGPAVVIGSVSGVNGNPPATTFTDTNPATSGTVVYTITTTLVPDPGTNTQRESPPSPPAVLTVDQTIVLGSLPSSVSIANSSIKITATAQSNGSPNMQLVSFSTSGPCSADTSSIDGSGVSSATVTLSNTGSCTITATQGGNSTTVQSGNAYNAADPVSGTFSIVSADSNFVSQTINFPQLASAQYGSSPVPVSATSSPSGFSVSFTASGPCTINGNAISITGAGTCKVTASAPSGPGPNNTTYSAASVTQSFSIAPAVLTVAAGNLTINYGQQIPSLTNDYTVTGYVNGESPAVLNNTVPALSTTATSSSAPGTYPITVSTGNLAATNYSFLYMPGTLTIKQATATISISNIPASATYGGGFVPTYLYSGTGTPTKSTTSSTLTVCRVVGSSVIFVGVGTCTLSAHATATSTNAAVDGIPQSFIVNKALLTVTANNASRLYGAANPTFTAKYTGFVNSDTSAVVTGSPSLTTTATAASLPGSYPIAAAQGSLTAANYTFNFANGTLTITYTGSVPPAGTACNGAYSGTFKGNLTVSKGQTCIFVGGGTTGSITGTGGTIILNGAAIGSNVTIISGGAFTIGPSTTIKGNLTIQSLPKSTTANQVCGSTITGSLVYQSDGAPILIGSGTPSCAGNIIKGSLQVASNSAAVTMYGNSVTGSIQVQSNPGATTINGNSVGVSVQVQSNTGATQIFTNIITNALQCQSNSAITGGGNKAAVKQGQCSKF